MIPIVSLIATLISMGVAFSFIHLAVLWLQMPDLVALLLFAIPVVGYIAYCSHNTRRQAVRSGLTIYFSFTGVTLAAAGLAYLIG